MYSALRSNYSCRQVYYDKLNCKKVETTLCVVSTFLQLQSGFENVKNFRWNLSAERSP